MFLSPLLINVILMAQYFVRYCIYYTSTKILIYKSLKCSPEQDRPYPPRTLSKNTGIMWKYTQGTSKNNLYSASASAKALPPPPLAISRRSNCMQFLFTCTNYICFETRKAWNGWIWKKKTLVANKYFKFPHPPPHFHIYVVNEHGGFTKAF